MYISHSCVGWWLGVDQAPSHHPNQQHFALIGVLNKRHWWHVLYQIYSHNINFPSHIYIYTQQFLIELFESSYIKVLHPYLLIIFLHLVCNPLVHTALVIVSQVVIWESIIVNCHKTCKMSVISKTTPGYDIRYLVWTAVEVWSRIGNGFPHKSMDVITFMP